MIIPFRSLDETIILAKEIPIDDAKLFDPKDIETFFIKSIKEDEGVNLSKV